MDSPRLKYLCAADSHSSPGMLEFQEMIKQVHPGIFIHSIFIEEDLDKDRLASFYGHVNVQLEQVAEQLAGIPELQMALMRLGFLKVNVQLRSYPNHCLTANNRRSIPFGPMSN
ncbi:hypothetical protein MPER_03713, partial [Moniliophthora perniciosa FA553]